jgi:hypothetical protein
MRVGKGVRVLFGIAVIVAVALSWSWWQAGGEDRKLERLSRQVSVEGYRQAGKLEESSTGGTSGTGCGRASSMS